MNAEKKQRFFDLLVKIGVKEIEVGFPSASATDFDFVRGLVRDGQVPQDVMVQVPTQFRRDLIERSFESLAGARAATVHLYNAIAPAWREVVFGLDRSGVKASAITEARLLREQAESHPDTVRTRPQGIGRELWRRGHDYYTRLIASAVPILVTITAHPTAIPSSIEIPRHV